MRKTGADALTRHCPFARNFDEAWALINLPLLSANVAYNRFDGDATADGCRCVADNCMAWEWVRDKHDMPETDNKGEIVGRCTLMDSRPTRPIDATIIK